MLDEVQFEPVVSEQYPKADSCVNSPCGPIYFQFALTDASHSFGSVSYGHISLIMSSSCLIRYSSDDSLLKICFMVKTQSAQLFSIGIAHEKAKLIDIMNIAFIMASVVVKHQITI